MVTDLHWTYLLCTCLTRRKYLLCICLALPKKAAASDRRISRSTRIHTQNTQNEVSASSVSARSPNRDVGVAHALSQFDELPHLHHRPTYHRVSTHQVDRTHRPHVKTTLCIPVDKSTIGPGENPRERVNSSRLVRPSTSSKPLLSSCSYVSGMIPHPVGTAADTTVDSPTKYLN